MTSLFEDQAPRPLADRMRPQRISDVVGQDHLLAPDAPVGRMLTHGTISSILMWGPPGTGKTTIARLLADGVELAFEPVSAVFSGVAELRRIFERAMARRVEGQGTLLFVDEIHRFNKAQQDALLPFVEDGTVIFVGATTENPSFEVNSALLSRCQVIVLQRLDADSLRELIRRAEERVESRLPLTDEAMQAFVSLADGDGRYLLNMVEALINANLKTDLDRAGLGRFLSQRVPNYDKKDEGHYNLISALHKSVRGSDPDASLYWLARMLNAGEDPLYIARRVIRMAVEDIGLADPNALTQATAAKDAYAFLGSPDGELAIVQAVLYIATAPKSNAVYKAFSAARNSAEKNGSLMPPNIILNAPTQLMRDLNYGSGYVYDHDVSAGFSGQDYFPDTMTRETYYRPVERGFEREVQKRLAYWNRLRNQQNMRGS